MLVVDDNATNLRLLSDLLRNMGLKPTLAGAGKEALALMNNRAPFPLVLLDAQMPEMDGMALALEIMSTPSLRHCTLIMLSSTGSRIDKAVLKKSGSPFPDEAYRCRGTVCRHGAGADADATERARSCTLHPRAAGERGGPPIIC